MSEIDGEEHRQDGGGESEPEPGCGLKRQRGGEQSGVGRLHGPLESGAEADSGQNDLQKTRHEFLRLEKAAGRVLNRARRTGIMPEETRGQRSLAGYSPWGHKGQTQLQN